MKDGPQTRWSTTRLGSTPDLSGTWIAPLHATVIGSSSTDDAHSRKVQHAASKRINHGVNTHHYALHSKLRQKSTLENASCQPRPHAQTARQHAAASVCRVATGGWPAAPTRGRTAPTQEAEGVWPLSNSVKHDHSSRCSRGVHFGFSAASEMGRRPQSIAAENGDRTPPR